MIQTIFSLAYLNSYYFQFGIYQFELISIWYILIWTSFSLVFLYLFQTTFSCESTNSNYFQLKDKIPISNYLNLKKLRLTLPTAATILEPMWIKILHGIANSFESSKGFHLMLLNFFQERHPFKLALKGLSHATNRVRSRRIKTLPLRRDKTM